MEFSFGTVSENSNTTDVTKLLWQTTIVLQILIILVETTNIVNTIKVVCYKMRQQKINVKM